MSVGQPPGRKLLYENTRMRKLGLMAGRNDRLGREPTADFSTDFIQRLIEQAKFRPSNPLAIFRQHLLNAVRWWVDEDAAVLDRRDPAVAPGHEQPSQLSQPSRAHGVGADGSGSRSASASTRR